MAVVAVPAEMAIREEATRLAEGLDPSKEALLGEGVHRGTQGVTDRQ